MDDEKLSNEKTARELQSVTGFPYSQYFQRNLDALIIEDSLPSNGCTCLEASTVTRLNRHLGKSHESCCTGYMLFGEKENRERHGKNLSRVWEGNVPLMCPGM
jgi:hypothetical protein